nr:unnamed protein product [Digitaria exilis]
MEVASRRVLLAVLAAAFALLLAIRRVSIVSPPAAHQQQEEESFKLPAAVAEALVYYATSRVTPQLTASEAGLENTSWIASVRAAHPRLSLEVYHVVYDTKLTDADDLLELRSDPRCVGQPDLNAAAAAACRLAPPGLPAAFYEAEWDVVLVDAPTGYAPWTPGRMGAIYAAGMAARARRRTAGATTDVLVHDVDRPVEDTFSRAFLCEAYEVEQVGKLRRFVVPSHWGAGDGDDDAVPRPFCPPASPDDEDAAAASV